MTFVEWLEQQYRVGRDPRTMGLAPVTVARMQLATSPRGAWTTLAQNYDPATARRAWDELTAVQTRPAGQAVPPAPGAAWLVPLGLAAVAGALFAATVWWVPRATAGR